MAHDYSESCSQAFPRPYTRFVPATTPPLLAPEDAAPYQRRREANVAGEPRSSGRQTSSGEITLREGDPEVEQEWAVARTLAIIKVVLATANFYVILLDNSVPFKNDATSLRLAFFAATALWVYMVGALVAVRFRKISIRAYEWLTPILDVVLSAVLIYVTDGYASPFNTWLVLAVVATGFSPDRRIPVLTTVLAVGVHVAMARIPQEEPLSLALLAVRASYPFGFAAMVVALGSALARQARALGVVERTGAALGAAKTQDEAGDLLFMGFRRLFGAPAVELVREEGSRRFENLNAAGSKTMLLQVRSGSLSIADVQISRRRAFSDSERRWGELLAERYATCIRRLMLADELLRASAQAERMRMADEMHDGHLQTLTAVGLFLEGKRMRGTGKDLDEVCGLVRQATLQARELLSPRNEEIVGGEAHIRSIFEDRWTRDYSICFDPDLELSEGMWGVLETLVKEGLNNARRHAGAKRATLAVRREEAQILFVLETDGRSPDARVRFGYGLTSLKMKSEANNGRMSLARGSEGGASLSVVFGEIQ